MKRWWIKSIVMNITLFSLFQDHHPILPSLHPLPSSNVLILYYKEGCPYANEVIEMLLESMTLDAKYTLITMVSIPHFPSPTLRIPIEDFYINYIGLKAIKEAIKTTIFN
jgi:hypothetical protein